MIIRNNLNGASEELSQSALKSFVPSNIKLEDMGRTLPGLNTQATRVT